MQRVSVQCSCILSPIPEQYTYPSVATVHYLSVMFSLVYMQCLLYPLTKHEKCDMAVAHNVPLSHAYAQEFDFISSNTPIKGFPAY